MAGTKTFIDTNVSLYLLSDDTIKAEKAEEILRAGATISVQVLNEMANVARRKLDMSWQDINELLMLIRSLCHVEPLTTETHDTGTFIAEQYRLNVYDAMIVAAALIGGYQTLYSEDMQDGLRIEKQLRLCNPFRSNGSNR